MTYQTHQEFAKPGVEQFDSHHQVADFSNSLQPEDFEKLSKMMMQSSGKADQALKEKGTLPELKIVDPELSKLQNVTPETIAKYGKAAAKDLNETSLELLNNARGVFSPEAQTANKIDKMAKDILEGPNMYPGRDDKQPRDWKKQNF